MITFINHVHKLHLLSMMTVNLLEIATFTTTIVAREACCYPYSRIGYGGFTNKALISVTSSLYFIAYKFVMMMFYLLQAELESARSENQKWHSAFENGPVTPAGSMPG